jgi:hypothetical protein
MNNKLLLICLILLLIFTLEWLYADSVQQQLLTTSSAKTQASSATLMPKYELNEQAENSYSDLVNRPLFIPGRRPVADTNTTVSTGVTNNSDWQLSGVYTTKKGLMALLENTAESKTHRKVLIGTELNGWAVADIYNDRIRLTRGSEEKILLLRKPRKTADPVKNETQQPFNSGRAARMRPEPPAETQPEQTTDTATKDNNANHQ